MSVSFNTLFILATLLLPLKQACAQFYPPSLLKQEDKNQCFTVMLDEPGGTMEKITQYLPRIAQSAGSCSFNAAVQMFDAWRIHLHEFKESVFTSPIELDYRIHRESKQGILINGGETVKNLQTLFDEGGCKRSFFDAKTGRDQDEYELRLMSDLFFELRNQYFQQKNIPNNYSSPPLMNTALYSNFLIFYPQAQIEDVIPIVEKIKRKFLEINQAELVFKLNTHPDSTLLFQSFMSGNFIAFTQNLFDIGCDETKRTKITKAPTIEKVRQAHYLINGEWAPIDDTLASIDYELNRGPQNAMPVEIGYCSTVLTLGDAYITFQGDCGKHSSMVIGRRYNDEKKQCEYLIRNSWGCKNCYAKQFEQVKGKDHLWISGDLLSRAVFEVTKIHD